MDDKPGELIETTSNSYCAYQAFYQSPDGLSESASAISWIGSIQTFLTLGINLVSGCLYDRGYYRSLLWTGSFLLVFGQLILSLSTAYYQVFLAQGLCMGLGGGLVSSPGLTILTSYFDRRLDTAVGIACSGSSVGGIILPMTFNHAIPVIGFPLGDPCIGVSPFRPPLHHDPRLAAASAAAPPCLHRTEPLAHRPRTRIPRLPARRRSHLSHHLYPLVLSAGVRQHGPTPQRPTDTYLLYIFTALGAADCLCLSALANYAGPLNVLSLCVLVSGTLSFALVDLHSRAGLLTDTVLDGFFSAAVYALASAGCMELIPSPAVVGARVGMGYACLAVGRLVGPPIAGALLDRYGFDRVWVFVGVGTIAGAGLFVLGRGIRGGFSLWVRA